MLYDNLLHCTTVSMATPFYGTLNNIKTNVEFVAIHEVGILLEIALHVS